MCSSATGLFNKKIYKFTKIFMHFHCHRNRIPQLTYFCDDSLNDHVIKDFTLYSRIKRENLRFQKVNFSFNSLKYSSKNVKSRKLFIFIVISHINL